MKQLAMTREHASHPRQVSPIAIARIAPVDRRALVDLMFALLGVLLTLAVLLSAAQAHAAKLDDLSDAAARHVATEQWLQPLPSAPVAMTGVRSLPLTGYILAGLLSWVVLTVGRALLVRADAHDTDRAPIDTAIDVDDAPPLHLPTATPARKVKVAA